MRARWISAVAALVILQTLTTAVRAEPVRSGPQVGQSLPGPFKPLNVNGPDAGQKACLYCRYGTRPVVMIFAREITPTVRTLIQRLEAATAANTDSSLGSCVIVCSDSESIAGQLAVLAQQDRLNQVILAVYKATGPTSYNIAPDADLTVLLYSHVEVKANHAFRKGEFTEQHIAAILADLSKILPPR